MLVIQGQVDRWRIERRFSHRLHESLVEKPLSITDFAPLPYDDELTGQESSATDKEIYEFWKAQGALG